MFQMSLRDEGARLVLRGRLEMDPGSGFHVLNCASGVVRLNPTAAAILELCDGRRTRSEIAAHLSRQRRKRELALLVRKFLDTALQNAWIAESGMRPLGVNIRDIRDGSSAAISRR